MLELIAKTGLLFSQPLILASIVLVGFLNRNEALFGRTLFILLFTMVYNVYLKSIWQIPLPAPLEGWAFPSGHMHSTMAFWGALALEYKRFWFRILVLMILAMSGFALVYSGYHYPIDILGAVAFGSLTLLVYRFLLQQSFCKELPYRLGFLLIPLATLCILLTPPEARKLHLWQAYGAMIGFTIGWGLLSTQQLTKRFTFNAIQRLKVLSMALAGALCAFYFIQALPLSKQMIIFSQFFIIAIWVNTSKIIMYQVGRK
ncbi:MAG: phosphatase PAP2 family protein [Candidatus Berkiella sp.]